MVDKVVVKLTDARAIRAIAHAARQQVINILYKEQTPMTSTGLADRTGLSPSAMSYHLRALERWGLVVRDESMVGDGRTRPWRAAGTEVHIKADHDASGARAADAFLESMIEEQRQRIRFMRTLPESEQEGYTAMSEATRWLGLEDVVQIQRDIEKLLDGYPRRKPSTDDQRRVGVTYSVLPDPR